MPSRHQDPRIVAFVCEWHPLASADNAGADGCTYGAGTTIVPVQCAGVVTCAAILRALARGARGVLIAACGRGDCHYSNGNESCERVVEEAHELMKLSGLQPERLKLDLSSEVEGQRFADLVSGFASELTELDAAATKRQRRQMTRQKRRGRTSPAGGRTAGNRKPARGRARAASRSGRTSGRR